MKHKTLFRLLLKFLGVWLAANGIVSVVSTLSSMVRATWFSPSSGTYTYAYWLSLPSGIVGVAMGGYLFFGGKWIVDMAIPSNRPYCHECGYDLSGAVGSICNECGTPFRAAPEVTSKHE